MVLLIDKPETNFEQVYQIMTNILSDAIDVRQIDGHTSIQTRANQLRNQDRGIYLPHLTVFFYRNFMRVYIFGHTPIILSVTPEEKALVLCAINGILQNTSA